MLIAAEGKLACDTCCESLVFTNNIKIKHIELRTFQPNIDLSSCRACSLEVCRCSMLPLSTWRLSDTWKRNGSDQRSHDDGQTSTSRLPRFTKPLRGTHQHHLPSILTSTEYRYIFINIVCCRDRLRADQLLAILLNNKGIYPEYKPKEYLRTSHYRFKQI